MERIVTPLLEHWYFRPGFTPQDAADPGTEGFVPVCLPHTVREMPYHYFSVEEFQGLSCYKRRLELEESQKHHRIFVDFAGVMTAARVFCNGREVAFHKGGFTPFSVEVTDLLRWDGRDFLVVAVDSTERPDTPPFGYVVDYVCFGGIYREVALRAVPPAHILQVKAEARAVLEPRKALALHTELEAVPAGAVLSASLWEGETRLASCEKPLPAGTTRAELLLTDLAVRLWTPEDPALYTVQVALHSGADTDVQTLRTGFRTVKFTPEGFFLNEKSIKLRGLNRHQQYPYQGYAMPWRAQYEDADILKKELHLNIVRTSHYPQSPHFLDRCDELGLLVLEELPGWQHIGDDAWKDQSCRDLEAMIRRDWNHPSIVLWGVRINESPDDHDFYTRTNALAHQLDPTRPTGGVRCIDHSELLEDVYTCNDFVHEGGPLALRDQHTVTGRTDTVPYLVTEHNGHMYPTKRFDNEERLLEQALRHLRVLQAAAADSTVSGAIGWCAFDYNTHKDFGSGDKICYHGVMDMFRLPKFAAAVYRSQTGAEPVLEPLTHWTRGDRCGAAITPLVICTNCECVRVIINGVDQGLFKPDRASFPALEYPPVIVEALSGSWGTDWNGAEFIGYRGGVPVAQRRFTADPLPRALTLQAAARALQAGPWDTTRIVCRLVDDCGNPLPYAFNPVQLEAQGPGQIIGPTLVSLLGGEIAFWVRTTGEPGTLKVTAKTADGLAAALTLPVR